eukprot:TRINITY_DN25396_c0_g1_i1.p1 TRINITY_DN25396_c0_g1~~TRINITY_DN25396_c0_g1_i1.p1  ORF type:complete len:552 (+),score=200.62 TRINITY_DN25396_c0_g1_i1:52-1656(+)
MAGEKRAASFDRGDGGEAKKAKTAAGAPQRVGVHIFTRDLRLHDNRALHALAARRLDEVRFVFVFTKDQTADSKAKGYFGEGSFAFLVRALEDLGAAIAALGPAGARELEVYYGATEDVVQALHDDLGGRLAAVSIAADYTPYAARREARLREVAAGFAHPAEVVVAEDHCLTPGGLHTPTAGSGSFYRVFTPFYKNVSRLRPDVLSYDPAAAFPAPSAAASSTRYCNVHSAPQRRALSSIAERFLPQDAPAPPAVKTATRAWALNRCATFNYAAYSTNRNVASAEATGLSPHLKFGLVSAREAHAAISASGSIPAAEKESWIRQLYWRDFYMYVTLHNPGVLGKMVDGANANFAPHLEGLPWSQKEEDFERWASGRTGVPLVDAAMREMNATGAMHNRGRMVAAMFLTKNLMIDWRRGEQLFSQRLVDYDPCNNNGGWQWSSSTGADGSPYFRIMNPQAQLAAVDPDLKYVRKWVPEVADVAPKDLLKWENPKVHSKYVKQKGFKYTAPLVDLKATRARAIDIFKKTLEAAKH